MQGDSHAHRGPRPKRPGQSPRSPSNRLPTLASPRLGALAGDCWTPTPAPPGLRPTEKQWPAAPYAIPKLTPTPRDSRRRPSLNRKRPLRSHFPARRDPPYDEGPRGWEPATSTSAMRLRLPPAAGLGSAPRRQMAPSAGGSSHLQSHSGDGDGRHSLYRDEPASGCARSSPPWGARPLHGAPGLRLSRQLHGRERHTPKGRPSRHLPATARGAPRHHHWALADRRVARPTAKAARWRGPPRAANPGFESNVGE